VHDPAGDAGEGAASYLAVILLVAGIAGALVLSGVGGDVADHVQTGVCKASGGTDCEEDTTAAAAPVRGERPSDEDWKGRSTDPSKPPPEPTEEERRAGKDAAQEIRDYRDHVCAWWKPWTWGCDAPEDPVAVLDGMSPGEIAALVDELSDEELKYLLSWPGVPQILKLRADPAVLHRLEEISPRSIEPIYDDVRQSNGEKLDDPPTRWGAVPNGQLWGPGGQPSVEDARQGVLADCWFMSGMSGLASTEEGRARLKNMIRQNPNGTYTVTFPDGEEVTVTPYFPVDKDGDLTYAWTDDTTPVLWPLVLEKAYAAKQGSYGALSEGDSARAMKDLTGVDGFSQEPAEMNLDDLRGRLDSGHAVVVSTLDQGEVDGKEIYDDRLLTNHAYVVRGITEDGKVDLYNPWGRKHVIITMDEFRQNLSEVDMNPIR
jgi:hypothetical protein